MIFKMASLILSVACVAVSCRPRGGSGMLSGDGMEGCEVTKANSVQVEQALDKLETQFSEIAFYALKDLPQVYLSDLIAAEKDLRQAMCAGGTSASLSLAGHATDEAQLALFQTPAILEKLETKRKSYVEKAKELRKIVEEMKKDPAANERDVRAQEINVGLWEELLGNLLPEYNRVIADTLKTLQDQSQQASLQNKKLEILITEKNSGLNDILMAGIKQPQKKLAWFYCPSLQPIIPKNQTGVDFQVLQEKQEKKKRQILSMALVPPKRLIYDSFRSTWYAHVGVSADAAYFKNVSFFEKFPLKARGDTRVRFTWNTTTKINLSTPLQPDKDDPNQFQRAFDDAGKLQLPSGFNCEVEKNRSRKISWELGGSFSIVDAAGGSERDFTKSEVFSSPLCYAGPNQGKDDLAQEILEFATIKRICEQFTRQVVDIDTTFTSDIDALSFSESAPPQPLCVTDRDCYGRWDDFFMSRNIYKPLDKNSYQRYYVLQCEQQHKSSPAQQGVCVPRHVERAANSLMAERCKSTEEKDESRCARSLFCQNGACVVPQTPSQNFPALPPQSAAPEVLDPSIRSTSIALNRAGIIAIIDLGYQTYYTDFKYLNYSEDELKGKIDPRTVPADDCQKKGGRLPTYPPNGETVGSEATAVAIWLAEKERASLMEKLRPLKNAEDWMYGDSVYEGMFWAQHPGDIEQGIATKVWKMGAQGLINLQLYSEAEVENFRNVALSNAEKQKFFEAPENLLQKEFNKKTPKYGIKVRTVCVVPYLR